MIQLHSTGFPHAFQCTNAPTPIIGRKDILFWEWCRYSPWHRHLVSSPEALPLSYRRLVVAREIKLGTVWDMSMNILLGKLSKIVVLKNPAFTKCWFNTAAYMYTCMLWFSFILGFYIDYFLSFSTHYHTLPYPKQREIRFKPSMKLNLNIDIWESGKCRGILISDYTVHLQQNHR